MKKRTKRLFSLVMAIVMVLVMMPAGALQASAATALNMYYDDRLPIYELGGDASTLMQNMQNVIDAFSHEEQNSTSDPAEKESPAEDIPFDLGFEDADSLFDETTAPKAPVGDPFDFDEDEDENPTRVINLDNLQFGRNYTKD